jgi:hypothetical protein
MHTHHLKHGPKVGNILIAVGRLIIIYYMSMLQNFQITADTHTKVEMEVTVIPPCVNSNLTCIKLLYVRKCYKYTCSQ